MHLQGSQVTRQVRGSRLTGGKKFQAPWHESLYVTMHQGFAPILLMYPGRWSAAGEFMWDLSRQYTNRIIMRTVLEIAAVAAPMLAGGVLAAEPKAGESPADHLPPHITRVTFFGERADWSHDGKRILFLSKTFGDAMELDLATRRIRNLTAHYPHHGYTRALYLANGDILLSGPEAFDPTDVKKARVKCSLYVLDRRLNGPAKPLGTRCSEGPAVSRKRMHVAWTHVAAQHLGEMLRGSSRMLEADVVVKDGELPRLEGQRVVLESEDLPFKCTLETQNFRPA